MINAAFRPNYAGLSQFYSGELSPLSSESIEDFDRKAKAKEERDKFLKVVFITGQLIIATAGVSAGLDGLGAQRA